MQAAVLREVGVAPAVESVDPAAPGPRDVVVRLEATGLCHGDISASRGHLGVPLPLILGHEAAGTVVETGSSVTGVAVGDRVIAGATPVCGQCFWCVNGETHLCAETMTLRAATRGRLADDVPVTAMLGLGAFAETMTVDERLTVRVESDLPAEQLAMISCGIATGVGAVVSTARVRPGSSVAVIGCGGVGQAVIQGARIAGAARIVAVDPVELKRTVARHSGATDVVDPGAGDVVEQVRELTRGLGADYAFEVVGSPATVTTAYHCARRGGTIVTVGIPPADSRIDLPATDFFRAGKHLVGSYYGSTRIRSDFQRYADLIAAGRLDAASLITTRYPLDRIGDAFADLEAGLTIRGVVGFS